MSSKLSSKCNATVICATVLIAVLVLVHLALAPKRLSIVTYLPKIRSYRTPIKTTTTTQAPPTPKRVLSYSLFGKDSLKNYGKLVTDILKDASKSEFYNTWEVRLYVDQGIEEQQMKTWVDTYPRFVVLDVRKYTQFPNVQLKNGMCWRFLPIGDAGIDISCIRDLDSPLLKREEEAVKEFIPSKFIFHGMRDNVQHTAAIMGGMWCFRNSKNTELGKSLLKKVLEAAQSRVPGVRESGKGDDQNVLSRIVWPVVKTDSMNHCSFHCTMQAAENTRPFPMKRSGNEFIGCQRWDCHYGYDLLRCPNICKPKNHKDWTYC